MVRARSHILGIDPLTGDRGALPRGEVPASAGQDQVPGPAGADHDPVPQRRPVGAKVNVGECAGVFSVCFVSWFGSEAGGVLKREKKFLKGDSPFRFCSARERCGGKDAVAPTGARTPQTTSVKGVRAAEFSKKFQRSSWLWN